MCTTRSVPSGSTAVSRTGPWSMAGKYCRIESLSSFPANSSRQARSASARFPVAGLPSESVRGGSSLSASQVPRSV